MRILFDRVAYACLRGRRMRGRDASARGSGVWGGGEARDRSGQDVIAAKP